MKRKHYTVASKAKIVVETLREIKTVAQLAAENGLHPNLSGWKAKVCRNE
jgi:transposase-like protein